MTDTAPLAVIDFLTHSKVAIAADTRKIWPHIIDLSGWRTGQQLVLVHGDLGSVGARFYAAAVDPRDTALFNVENVEMVAGQRRTVRLDTLQGAFLGFATWELTPNAGGTIVAYDVYCRGALLPPGQSEPALIAEAQKAMDEGLLRLKAVVEG